MSQYIGSTKRTILTRISEHKTDLKNLAKKGRVDLKKATSLVRFVKENPARVPVWSDVRRQALINSVYQLKI